MSKVPYYYGKNVVFLKKLCRYVRTYIVTCSGAPIKNGMYFQCQGTTRKLENCFLSIDYQVAEAGDDETFSASI
jgi:hypothetical protein